jgi:hypothetical protein
LDELQLTNTRVAKKRRENLTMVFLVFKICNEVYFNLKFLHFRLSH